MIRPRSAAALLVCISTVLACSGCYQGEGKTVLDQGPSGNGTDFTLGEMQVQGLTVVADESGAASLVATFINKAATDDWLVDLGTDPSSDVTMQPAAQTPPDATDAPPQRPGIFLPAGEAVRVGGTAPDQIELADLATEPGRYLSMTMGFAASGTVTKHVVVVPNSGYYEAFGPSSSATPEPTDEESPDDSQSPDDQSPEADESSEPAQGEGVATEPEPLTSPTN